MKPHAFAYLDDIIVIGATWEDHARNLREVFRRLREANLRLNRGKCQFFQRRLVYLGHLISEEGIRTDPKKIKAIQGLHPPTNVKELRRHLGIASWYRRFAQDFASLVQPMSGLLRKGVKWTWEEPQQQAFNLLKARIDYQFGVLYRKGKYNVVADDLSRQPLGRLQLLAELKCHCKWVRKMHEQVQRRPEKFPDYSLDNGQLYRHIGHPTGVRVGNPWKLGVPRKQRQRVLGECHVHPSAGHLGIRKTLRRVAQRYCWPGLHRDVVRYVTSFLTCQQYKTSLDPFPGPDAKTPRRLICDNGTQFTIRSFRAFYRNNGIQLEYTAPYSPQQNSTERANRTIKTMIAQYVN
ncbi:uncharacterized protein K02A2.6-like [Drosophila gunungcola]|uniref:uncharacterized protein K02A2.6-like n=1 Tax=Drosophila gunungcola TaxID=103775 RepID=UPI0022DF1A42|nr:uncharacterized protein K02A2.6-like [Drosophila gunungcola]